MNAHAKRSKDLADRQELELTTLSHAARVLRIREMLDTHPYLTATILARYSMAPLESGDEEDVELLFEPAQAEFVKERHWHPTQVFTRAKDGRTRMTMRVKGLEDVYRWLVGHMDSVEVVEPESLRQRLYQVVRRRWRS